MCSDAHVDYDVDDLVGLAKWALVAISFNILYDLVINDLTLLVAVLDIDVNYLEALDVDRRMNNISFQKLHLQVLNVKLRWIQFHAWAKRTKSSYKKFDSRLNVKLVLGRALLLLKIGTSALHLDLEMLIDELD